MNDEYDRFFGFDSDDLESIDLDEEKQDPVTTEKIIEVFQDATEILRPGIEKVREKVKDSGIDGKHFSQAETDFFDKGDDVDQIARGVVSVLGEPKEE